MSTAPTITFHDYAGMVEAFRQIKDHLGLSNAALDELCNFTSGHSDKLLGPTGARGFGPLTLNAMFWALAVKVEITIDLDRAREMEAYWEGRFAPNVRHETTKISKALIKRAKPHVMRDFGRIGGQVRAHLLSPEQVKAIARKAAHARRRKLTRKQRRAIAEKAGRASQAKRRADAAALLAATQSQALLLAPCATQCRESSS